MIGSYHELWNIEKSFRMIDGLGIAWYTLRYGLNADGTARWSPGSWTGSLRAARQGGMMVSTQLANKKLLIKY